MGTRLLTQEDLAAVVALPEFREAFEARLAKFWQDVLERERGSLHDELGPDAIDEIAPMARKALEGLLDQLRDYVHSERFDEDAAGWAQDLAAFAAKQPVAELLTPDREAQAVEIVRGVDRCGRRRTRLSADGGSLRAPCRGPLAGSAPDHPRRVAGGRGRDAEAGGGQLSAPGDPPARFDAGRARDQAPLRDGRARGAAPVLAGPEVPSARRGAGS